jgi:hypothetical protein
MSDVFIVHGHPGKAEGFCDIHKNRVLIRLDRHGIWIVCADCDRVKASEHSSRACLRWGDVLRLQSKLARQTANIVDG